MKMNPVVLISLAVLSFTNWHSVARMKESIIGLDLK